MMKQPCFQNYWFWGENKLLIHPKIQKKNQNKKTQTNHTPITTRKTQAKCRKHSWPIILLYRKIWMHFFLYFCSLSLILWAQDLNCVLKRWKASSVCKDNKTSWCMLKTLNFSSIRNICLFQEGYQKTCPGRNTNWENVCGSIWNNHNRINNKIFTMTR